MIIQGDCIEEMKKLEENSVDAIITDPPYGLEFMGKEWDSPLSMPGHASGLLNKQKGAKSEGYRQMLGKMPLFQDFAKKWAKECLRVLKPGGFLLSFGGTRTYHRMTCGIEDAGFEIRDTIMWLYGSGFPKSLNIGKQIDKMAEPNEQFFKERKEFQDYLKDKLYENYEHHKVLAEELGVAESLIRHWIGKCGDQHILPTWKFYIQLKDKLKLDDTFTYLIEDRPKDYIPAEREVIGKGQAKFLEKNKVFELDNKGYGDYDLTLPSTKEAKEWEGWGTALKPAVEPIVVARKPLSEKNVALNVLKWGTGGINIDACRIGTMKQHGQKRGEADVVTFQSGGFTESRFGRFPANIILDEEAGKLLGEASRFFYCAKTSKSERNFGMEEKQTVKQYEDKSTGHGNLQNSEGFERFDSYNKNNHPTVKPIKLMEHLIKLISKEGATILDPFMGSGTTLVACAKLNRIGIGIEKEHEYIEIANARIKPYLEQSRL